jgi:membrane-bound metal-dependent hydrolase YbcI (DUF457 family)
MPQNGFHGIVGLGAAKLLAKHVSRENADPFVGAVVLGAMLPDVDMYPTAVAFLANRMDLIYVIHRSLTHSLPLILLLLLIGAVVRAGPSRFVYWGLAIGMATHVVLDTLFWFTQIDLFWPFSHVPSSNPLLPIVNLWQDMRPGVLFVNVREAFEFLAYALLLMALAKIAPQIPDSRRWQLLAWACFGVTLITAFLFRQSSTIQHVLVTAPYLLLFLPYVWLTTWKHRREIAAWAYGGPRTGVKPAAET